MLKYAYELRLTAPSSAAGVPTVGIVFGNYELPSLCHEYMNASYRMHKLKVHITTDNIIAKIDFFEMSDENIIFSLDLNYDKNELLNFKEKTLPDSKVALIFGFKRGCDYYMTGKMGDKSEDFSPMVLEGYNIKIL